MKTCRRHMSGTITATVQHGRRCGCWAETENPALRSVGLEQARRGDIAMSKVSELHREWSKDPEYREAYDRLEPEFALSRMLIEARTRAALTQAELAERMETTQSVVARLESGRIHPSTRTLERIARATGTRLRISFDPA
jgi:ribosome-binding protein aMBF1 (putative translation factor)